MSKFVPSYSEGCNLCGGVREFNQAMLDFVLDGTIPERQADIDWNETVQKFFPNGIAKTLLVWKLADRIEAILNRCIESQ